MFGVNDKVRYSAFGKVGDSGVVVKVFPLPMPIGGVRVRYRVRWNTYGAVGAESTVDDRVLVADTENA